MRDVSPELAAAILSPERVTVPRLYVDWDNDGYDTPGIDDLSDYAGQIQIRRTLETDLPDQVRAVAGISAATGTIDLARGNPFGQRVDVTYRSASTVTSGSGTGTSISLPAPAGTRPGDVLLVWIAVVGSSIGHRLSRPYTSNVAWAELAARADYNADGSQGIEATLLTRRVTANDPATYTWTLGYDTRYAATAVLFGDQHILGVHGYAAFGQSDSTTATATWTLPPLTTTLDGCVAVSFLAARAGAGGGLWVAAPAGDTQRVNAAGTHATASPALLVATSPTVAPGTYTKQATFAQAITECVGVVVALAPMPGGSEAQHAAWTFSELNGDSQFAGKDRLNRRVSYAVGFATAAGVQYVPQLVGQTRRLQVSSGQRHAALDVLDNRAAFRSPAMDRTFAMLGEWPTYLAGYPERYPGLGASWLASYLFATANNAYNDPTEGLGFYTSPPPRASAMTWVPMHGSAEPFIGALNYAYTLTSAGLKRRVKFGPGPFVAGTEPCPINGQINIGTTWSGAARIWNSTARGSGRIEYWVRLTGTAATLDAGAYDYAVAPTRYSVLQVLATGRLQWTARVTAGVTTTRTVTGPTIPSDGGWHFVGVHWDLGAGTLTFRLDGQSVASSFTAFPSDTLADTFAEFAVGLRNGSQIAEFQVCGGVSDTTTSDVITPGAAWLNENFTPTAFVDRSDNELDAVLAVGADVDMWGLLQDLAAANYDQVHIDEDGYPHYRTRRTLYTTGGAGQVQARTLTADTALTDLEYDSGSESVRNQITVPVSPIEVVRNKEAWRQPAPVLVPAGQSVVFYVDLPGFSLGGAGSAVTVAACNTLPDGSGTDLSGLTVSYSLLFVGNRATLVVTNPQNYDVWLVDVTGNPTASFTASWVTSSSTTPTPSSATDATSQRRYGVQPLDVPSNMWRQRADVADLLAAALVADLKTPQPTLTNVTTVGDPRLQLGDRVGIQDVDGVGLDGDYWLTGISPTHDVTGGFTQTLNARRAKTVAVWGANAWGDGTVWGTGG